MSVLSYIGIQTDRDSQLRCFPILQMYYQRPPASGADSSCCRVPLAADAERELVPLLTQIWTRDITHNKFVASAWGAFDEKQSREGAPPERGAPAAAALAPHR